ncbi:MAG: hypothetical protein Q7S27_03220 [Nanoarchaeota archaeon]|nr:hypothetical protein [Nanoarchaeota archaeon]
MKGEVLQKYYTRIIGVFFILIFFSFMLDWIEFGHRVETWHKVFHVLLGLIVVKYGWSNKTFWKPFCLINGAFFTFVALFGWTFMDFGGLDAFNLTDTILHSIVGVSGLVIGLVRN